MPSLGGGDVEKKTIILNDVVRLKEKGGGRQE